MTDGIAGIVKSEVGWWGYNVPISVPAAAVHNLMTDCAWRSKEIRVGFNPSPENNLRSG